MLPTRSTQGVRVLESMAAIVHLGVIETHLGIRPWESDWQFRYSLSDERQKQYEQTGGGAGPVLIEKWYI